MTDSLNPWQPRWVRLDPNTSLDDALYEGMSVRIESCEPETVVAIRSYDVDQEGDSYTVTPIGVRVEEDGEWWHLHEVEFLAHELEYGKACYEAKLIMGRATTRITYRDGERRSNGRPPVYPSDFTRPENLVRVRTYDATGRRTDVPF